MKKVVLATLLTFVGLTVFAIDNTLKPELDETVIFNLQDFEEISVSDLPEAVVSAVSENYPTAKIDKAYKNENDQYKLDLSLEDGTTGTVYSDAQGNWIEL